MKVVKHIMMAIVLASVLSCAACSGEEGLRKGVVNGLDTGTAYAIKTPITYIVDKILGK